MNQYQNLKSEDYLEPDCPLTQKPEDALHSAVHIPQKRITEKMDELMALEDFAGAERLLNYWLLEAKQGLDLQGEFYIYNEQMGFYRQRNEKEKAYEAIEHAFDMLEQLNYTDSISGATCYVNAATVYCVFNEEEKALALDQKALKIYQNNLEASDYRIGGLYNNMAQTLSQLSRYDEAIEYFKKAIEVMLQVEEGKLEAAISCLNIVDAISAKEEESLESILFKEKYLEKAKSYLDDPALKENYHYAYVASKCVGIFEYYGYFVYAKELKERIRRIHEGN